MVSDGGRGEAPVRSARPSRSSRDQRLAVEYNNHAIESNGTGFVGKRRYQELSSNNNDRKKTKNLKCNEAREGSNYCDWLEIFLQGCCLTIRSNNNSNSSNNNNNNQRRYLAEDGAPLLPYSESCYYSPPPQADDKSPLLRAVRQSHQYQQQLTRGASVVPVVAATINGNSTSIYTGYDMVQVESEPPLHAFGPRFQGLCPLGHQEVVLFP